MGVLLEAPYRRRVEMKRVVLTLVVVGITWFWLGNTAEAAGHGRGCSSCETSACDPCAVCCDPCDRCCTVGNGYSYRYTSYRPYRMRYRSYRAAGWPYVRAYRPYYASYGGGYAYGGSYGYAGGYAYGGCCGS